METKIHNCTCGRKAEVVNFDESECCVVCTRTNKSSLDKVCWMGPLRSSKAKAIEEWNWAMKALDRCKGKWNWDYQEHPKV